MGTTLTSWVERKSEHGYETIKETDLFVCFEPFAPKVYSVYAFLAGVRNNAGITPINEPRGLPDDVNEAISGSYLGWPDVNHSASWLFVSELADFDYDQLVEYRRECSKHGVENSPYPLMTYRDFLGPEFFLDLGALITCKADRIVFWFEF